jgi:hypothetical protein
LIYSLPQIFCSAWLGFTHQQLGLAATFTGLPPVQLLLSEVNPNDFFPHSKGNANSLIRRDQFITFISQQYLMAEYPY